MEKLPRSSELARLLERNSATIQAEWAVALHALSSTSYARRPLAEIAGWTGRGLRAVVNSLLTGSERPLRPYLRRLVAARRRLGFGIDEVIDGLLRLEQVVLPHVLNRMDKDATREQVVQMVSDMQACTRTVVAAFGSSYASAMIKALEAEKSRSVQLLEESRTVERISSALLGEAGLFSMLELICRESKRLTSAKGAAILLPFDSDRLQVAVSVGDRPAGADLLLAEALWSGDAAAAVEPVVFDEPPETMGSPKPPTRRTIVGAPLRIHGVLVGILQVSRRGRAFGDDDIRLISRIADQAAIAMEHARLEQHHEHTLILEERQRVARDLHDSVTQSLYGVTMFAEAATRQIGTNDFTEAQANLSELRAIASRALWEMRLLIFELHPPELEREGLVAALQARLAMVEDRSGLATELHSDLRGPLPLRIENTLYRIAQEALNNAIKHARASTVSLRLTQRGRVVHLEVVDDGVGFDLKSGERKGGMGLQGMKERAAGVGGSVTVTTQPGRGTRVAIVVPLATEVAPQAANGVAAVVDSSVFSLRRARSCNPR